MAEAGRTVRVSGLPPDVENIRLMDKLLIHFLRARNGGGEINSVTIAAAASHSALITFEDSSVAQRVVERKWHILEVDGKQHKLTATMHQERLDPDQVILCLSATVSYSQLPGGVQALTSLRKSHRKVKIDYTASERCCTLSGSYSAVQAALTQLLGHAGGPELAESDDWSRQAAPSSSRSQESEDQSKKANKQREQKGTDNTDKPSDEESSRPNKNLAPGGNGLEANADTAPRSPATFTEDFSLIVDADMFQYLQKHCKKEYQRILSQYGVEAVSETTQGLTTLFLQVADAARTEDGHERLELARTAISRLYQENEAKICRDQLPKLILRPRGGLQRAMDALSVRFPKLLLNEDEQNVYIIGNTRDVSEAKSALLLDQVEAKDKKEDVASLLKFPSYNLGPSSARADEEGVPLTPPFAAGSLDEGLDETVKSEEDEFRATKYKLAARFKESGLGGLGSRPADLTFRPNSSPSTQTCHGPVLGRDVLSETTGIPAEAVSRAQNTGGGIPFKTIYMSSPSASNTDPNKTQFKNFPPPYIPSYSVPQSTAHHGPVLGRDVLSETTGIPAEAVSRAQNTGGDILFKTIYTSSPSTSNTDPNKTQLKTLPTPYIFPYNVPESTARHGPVLGRDVLSETTRISAEAVSRAQNTGGGIPFKSISTSSPSASNTDPIKTQLKTLPTPYIFPYNVPESTAHPPVGSVSNLKRAGSFSGTPQQKAKVVGLKSRDDSSKSTVRTVERSSSFSSLAVKDKQEVHNAEITVSKLIWGYIMEVYSTRVTDLTSEVQVKESSAGGSRELTVLLKGADSSKVRLCQEHLEKLIASVSADFTVKELSWSELGVPDSENETLQACCSEVRSRFQKIIVHTAKKALYLVGPEEMCSQVAATLREVFSGDPENHGLSSPSASMWNSAPSLQPNEPQSAHLNNAQLVLRIQTDKTDNQQWKTIYGRDFNSSSSVKKDHIVKTTGTEEDERATHRLVTEKDTSPVNGDLSVDKDRTLQTTQTGRRDTAIHNAGGQAYRCVCGEYGTPPVTSKCGIQMCFKCLETRHAHCRVCSQTEQTPWGIQGEMKKFKLNMSLQGHKDGVIKISYHIPDGIQGEGHPSPGKPFKGGTFEAFLPDSEKARKLLPRLEKAFRQGLTFTVRGKGTEAKVTWDCIPHKTSLQGGKAQKGYPDSRYLTRLSDALSAEGID